MPELHQGMLVVTRKPHYPTPHTRETVVHLTAFGLTEPQICTVLHCTADELKEHYAGELECGLERVNAQVQQALLHKALYERDVPAMKLWLTNKAGWKAGDGPRLINQQAIGVGVNGQLPNGTVVHERREVIERLITRATQEKRHAEKVIDGRVVAQPAAAKKANGGHNGSSGANGAGGNGAKHR